MRRASGPAILFACLTIFVFLLPAGAAAAPSQPSIRAASAILIDRSDGAVLWESNGHERRAVASTTKIVTALVVLANSDISEIVIASEHAEEVGEDDPVATEIELRRGDRVSVETLLYALLLESANDAAIALAEHVAGSVSQFVLRMNELAFSMGARDSQFVNPHGLDEPGHYSSAYDLALFARTALDNEVFRRIVGTVQFELRLSGRSSRRIENRNQLLTTYAGADGVKTGQTRASGRLLVASATRGTESRLAVLLSSPEPFSEAATVLDYGFDAFERHEIAYESVPWGYLTYGNGATRAIVPTRDGSVLVPTGEAQPEVRFSDDRLVVTSAGRKLEIPVVLECRSRPCVVRPPTPLARIFGQIAKLVAALTGMFAQEKSVST